MLDLGLMPGDQSGARRRVVGLAVIDGLVGMHPPLDLSLAPSLNLTLKPLPPYVAASFWPVRSKTGIRQPRHQQGETREGDDGELVDWVWLIWRPCGWRADCRGGQVRT